MTRRIVAGFLITALAVLIAHDVPFSIGLDRADRDAAWAALRDDATRLSELVEVVLDEALDGRSDGELDAAAADYRQQTGNDVIVFDASSTPIGVAAADERAVAAIARLDDTAAALRGEHRQSTFTGPAGSSTDTVTVPVRAGAQIRGAVYVGAPSSRRHRATTQRFFGLTATSILTLVAVAVVGVLLARSLNQHLAALHRATERFSTGDHTAIASEGSGPPAIRELAHAFNELTSRTRVALESQRGFAADASHQLRTPLTAIKLRLDQLALRLPDEDTEGAVILDATREETERLHRLIEGLLALARADANTSTETIDLARIARERHELWAPLAEERTVHLTLDIPDQLLATAVPGAAEQIIDNYLANALDVAPDHSIVCITARATSPHTAELRITDRGPGIPPNLIANAFDRFWRSPSSAHGGTGLGLSIVARLAHASGGTAELRNAPTGGLDAIARLPVARQEP